MNGFYIPIVNKKGELVFTPSDYDYLRSKMSGLSYYGENEYIISNNLVNEDILNIVNKIDENNRQTSTKKELIKSLIQEVMDEYNLKIDETISKDLSSGTIELIDIGSSGRGTNKFGDSDFDFMVRLDRILFYDETKLKEIKKKLLEKFQKLEHSEGELTMNGDFRLKQVSLTDDINTDIDITFIPKVDKMEYSTDMCLNDRFQSIKEKYPEKYDYVLANIIFAKEFLKANNAYKPKHASLNPQGGIGGVGVENWILQNGGSFMDAAKEFLKYSENKTFEEFISSYAIWDFGSNHLAVLSNKNTRYPHDNFIANNMSEEGYQNMRKALKKYVLEHSQVVNKKQ
jgi:hypothetical protein